MTLILKGIDTAIRMLLSGDNDIWAITWLTLRVCGTATLLSILLGVPVGASIAVSNFPGKRFVQSVVNSAMGLPPVVVGLWVSLFLWRTGPLGGLSLMYTKTALVIAQTLLAAPRVAALTMAAVLQVEQGLSEQIMGLGATRWQATALLMREARLSIAAAAMAGFGSIIAEVGAAMAVGGNIRGETRLLSTSIVLEVSKGNFDIALALSFILMTLTYLAAFALTMLQRRRAS